MENGQKEDIGENYRKIISPIKSVDNNDCQDEVKMCKQNLNDLNKHNPVSVFKESPLTDIIGNNDQAKAL